MPIRRGPSCSTDGLGYARLETQVTRERRGTIQEGECDFVLLDRKRGLLCAEVKGGSLVFDGRECVHEVRGEMRLLSKDPFVQATQCMHDIVDLVRHRFRTPGGEPPFTCGAAVALPKCRVSGALPLSIQPEQVLDAGRLRGAACAVRRVFERFGWAAPPGAGAPGLGSLC